LLQLLVGVADSFLLTHSLCLFFSGCRNISKALSMKQNGGG
jgi:hypothetical protein